MPNKLAFKAGEELTKRGSPREIARAVHGERTFWDVSGGIGRSLVGPRRVSDRSS